jgi:GNAT superfamily N-acetyltransferase
MTDWRIEPLREHPHLISVLAPLHQAEWAHMQPDMNVAGWAREFDSHTLFDLPITLVAINAQGGLLGSASLIMNDMGQDVPWSPWLANVLVLPKARGQGIGAALINAIEKQAQALGHAQLYLFTADQQHFYATRGWEAFEHRVHQNDIVTLMHKNLS